MRFLYTILFCTAIFFSNAQKLDFDEVVRPANELTSFEDYLVYLAWQNHPTANRLNANTEIAALEIKTEKKGYWEAIMPFVNLSRGNSSGFSAPIINPLPGVENPMTSSDGNSNGFSVGLSLRLLPLVTTKHRVDIAEENYKITKFEVNEAKLLIRREVLAAYRSLLFAEKIVEERASVEASSSENQRLVLELFKQDGGAEYEDVIAAGNTYHKAVEERLRAELDVEKEKLNIEQWIGIPLETAMQGFATVKVKSN